MFCCTLLYVNSSIAIILMGKRELVALLYLSSWCLVMVERLFLSVPRGCLRFVIVVFPDHTHLLFLENFGFALEVNSNPRKQKARKMYSKDENLYVMFVDLKSYVKGLFTHCQQKRIQGKQDNQGKVHFSFYKTLLAYEFSFLIPVFPNLFLGVENQWSLT